MLQRAVPVVVEQTRWWSMSLVKSLIQNPMQLSRLLLIGLSMLCVVSQAADDSVEVVREEGTLARRIEITSKNGRVAWSDVLRGISRARGFDDEILQGLLPGGRFSLESTSTTLQLVAYNLVLSPHVTFKIEEANEPKFVITINEATLLASRRRLKKLLREKLSRRGIRSRHYGLALDEGWQANGLQPVVIALHGLNSDASSASPILNGARRNGYACGTFQYPNDQPIEQSAQLLSRELRNFCGKYPKRRVSLVTHSMGGLVARVVVEDPSLDPGCVDQLIMIAPPNQGSLLAECNFGLDVWDPTLSGGRRDRASALYAAVEDGLSEAARDLRPGSQFLSQLNRRPRNARVRYTIILGTRGPLTEEERDTLHASMERAGDRNRWVRFFGSKVLTWIADLEEVVDGKGDGVVAVKRGQLEGVDDIVIRRFGHLRVLDPSAAEAREVHALVLERLP